MRHLDGRELAIALFRDSGEAQRVLSFRLYDEEVDENGEAATGEPPPRGHREVLLHLVVCPRCRRKLAAVLLTPAEPEEAGPESFEDELPFEFQTLLMAAEIELRGDHHRLAESDADRARLDALLQVPAPERLRTIHERPERFAFAGVAELLIGDAHRAVAEERLAEARHLAYLASNLLEGMPESTRHRRLLASAYSTVADVQRRCGILDGAEELLATAVRQLADDLVPDRSRARLCLSLGLLRQDQGRLDEAASLFQRARGLAEDLGAFDEQAQAALALGWLLLEGLADDLALEPLWEAYALLGDADPGELLPALHGLLLIHAVHDPSALPQLFGVLEEVGKLLPPPFGEVRVARIQAQVASRQGEHAAAAQGFGLVFRRLVEEGLGLEATAAALELARHLLEQNDPLTAGGLRQINRQLGTLEIAPELASVVNFVLSLPLRSPSSYFMDALAQAERWLRQARFNPDLPFFPLAEPEELLAWNGLSEQRRVSLASAAGAELRPVPHGIFSRLEPQTPYDRLLISWMQEVMTGARIVFPDFPSEEGEETAPG